MLIELLHRADLWRMLAVTVGISWFLTGCTLINSFISPSSSKAVAEKSSEPEVPFLLAVAEESNDGESLRVIVDVTPQVEWPGDNALARLATYRNGVLLHERYFPIAAALSTPDAQLSPQEKVSFLMEVASVGMTDYQLELLWGDDAVQTAEKLRGAAKPLLRVSDLEVERRREECNGFPCNITFVLRGIIENTGRETVGKIVLAVGFVRVNEEGKGPESEENVPLTGLNLAEGESRPLRLLIDRRISETEAGKYRPVLRILSFSTQ